MKIIDISVPIDRNLPLWPGSSGFKFKRIARIGGRTHHNETDIEMNAHVGTHVDAPLHFVKNGDAVATLPLEPFMGEALVVYLPKAKEITEKDLINIPKGTKRILFKTSNGKLWNKRFTKRYVGLTAGAAKWLSRRGVRLVGIDYLSIAKFDEAIGVHKILLGADIFILESLNLNKVKPGYYTLAALPIKLGDCEASPARAVLIK